MPKLLIGNNPPVAPEDEPIHLYLEKVGDTIELNARQGEVFQYIATFHEDGECYWHDSKFFEMDGGSR